MTAKAWGWPRLAAAGIALYLVFLVATLPAGWAGELLARVTQGQLRLQDPQGSLWRGSGTIALQRAGAQLHNRVHWNLQPLWLLTGRLRAEVRSEGDIALQAIVSFGYRRLRVQDLSGEFAAGHAQAFYAPAMLLSPTGQVKVNASEFELGKSGFSGEARLTWSGAGSKLGGAAEIGDYLLIANGRDGAAALRVETLRGDIKIDARGSWQAKTDGSLALEGSLVPGNREAALGPLLAALNVRKDGDRYPIRLNTRLPLPAILGGPG